MFLTIRTDPCSHVGNCSAFLWKMRVSWMRKQVFKTSLLKLKVLSITVQFRISLPQGIFYQVRASESYSFYSLILTKRNPKTKKQQQKQKKNNAFVFLTLDLHYNIFDNTFCFASYEKQKSIGYLNLVFGMAQSYQWKYLTQTPIGYTLGLSKIIQSLL